MNVPIEIISIGDWRQYRFALGNKRIDIKSVAYLYRDDRRKSLVYLNKHWEETDKLIAVWSRRGFCSFNNSC